jgi:hypothetical protein
VATRWREFHRVVEHICKNLHEPRAITVDLNRRRRPLRVQRVTRGRCERGNGFDRGRHQTREVQRFTTQLDFVGRDTRHIEEVVDESYELPDLTVDHIAGACRSRRRGIDLQGLQREPDRCEWVPELVRERREKFVLAVIRFDQLRGAVTNPEFKVSIQRFSIVLGSLETLDEILIVNSQLERGFNRPVESPGRHDGRDSEHCAQKPHHQVVFIRLAGQP